MALSTKSPMPSLQQEQGSSHTNTARATVTGVDSAGQLFRDQASLVYLKGQKCIYHSKCKPSSDGSVMIEIQSAQNAKESWRSNAKVERVSPIGPRQDAFRVTLELDRAHSLVIDAPDPAVTLQDAEQVEPQGDPSQPVVPAPAAPGSVRSTSAVSVTKESTNPDHQPVTVALPPPPATPMTTPAPRVMVADIVRSVTASEFAQLKRELQGAISNQVEAAMREPLQALETKLEQHSRTRPAITEETVRTIAAQVAESVQIEWATTKLQKMVAEAVRRPLAAEYEQRTREIAALLSSEIEAAVRGPVAAHIGATLEKALAAKWEQHSRTQPAISEETVRKIAAQAAESAQVEWANTQLQPMIAEAVRQPLASEHQERGRQVSALVSSEIEAAVRGPVAARIDATLAKALAAKWAEYARTPPPITEETVRQIAARVAEHPQLQSSLDALAANLSARWVEIARGASAGEQQDLKARVAATERMASEVISDIQGKLNSFGAEMERMFDRRQADPAASSPVKPRDSEPESQEKRVKDMLQTVGSQFEREMKAALQRVFGKL